MSITKQQAEQIKALSLDATFAILRYHDISINAFAAKKEAYEEMKVAETKFEQFVNTLVKE